MLGSAAGEFQNNITKFETMGRELSQVEPPPRLLQLSRQDS